MFVARSLKKTDGELTVTELLMELKNRRTVSTQYIKVDRFLYKTLNIYYYIVRWFRVSDERICYIHINGYTSTI